MGGLGVSFGGKAQGVEGAELSGASSAQRVQTQETDGPRGPGKSNAFSNSESCGTRLWGTGEAGREPDRPGHWAGQGEGQGWLEESGLQSGSILRVGGGMTAQSASGGQRNPIGSPEGDQNGRSDRFYKMNDRFLCSTFLVISTQRISSSQNSDY